MPPLWRPGLRETNKAKVIESKRLLPIAPRAGVYLTLTYANAARLSGRKGHRVLPKDTHFAAIFRQTWFRLPRRARMRLIRFWRDESWDYHDSAYSPRIVLLGHWPNRPPYRAGIYSGDFAVGHHFVFWGGAFELMPKKHIGTIIAGELARALFIAQRYIDGRVHGMPPGPRTARERYFANPPTIMSRKWVNRWGFDVDGPFKWFRRNARKLRYIDLRTRQWAYLARPDTEIVVCDRIEYAGPSVVC